MNRDEFIAEMIKALKNNANIKPRKMTAEGAYLLRTDYYFVVMNHLLSLIRLSKRMD